MSRPSPPFFLALVAIVWTASSGAAISVSLNEQPQEASPRWFLQRIDSVLNPADNDIEPPVIFNAHVSPMIMKRGDPRAEISAWVRDDVWVETVYAEVGGRYIPLIDLTQSGRYEGHCSSNLPPGDHSITIVAVDRAGNSAVRSDLVLRVLDPLDLNSNRIEDSLEKREERELRVIVLHEENVSLKSGEPEKVEEEFRVLPGTSMVVPRGELENLAKTEGVRGVYEDKKLTILGEVSEGYSPRTDPRFSVDDYVGRGMTVAILDTGADPNHRSLDDMDDDIFTDDPKIIAFKDFVNGREEVYDDHGHGTHCASLIAGTGETGGVAPGAKLVVIKVMDKDGACYLSDALTALDWCLENQDDLGIDVISFSVGGEGPSDGSTLLDSACDRMVDEGIVMCVAAGNSGPAARSIVTPGTAEKVITVGAMDPAGEIFQRSSRGPTPDNRVKPDLVAVGVNVTSAKSGTLHGEGTMDGTSMAAPQVAGAAAVILEKQPGLDPAAVKRVLLKSADDIGLSGPDNTYGYGALNLSSALSLVEEPEDRSDPEVFSLDLSRSTAMAGDPVMIEAGVSGDVSNVEVHVIGENRDIRIPMRDFDGNGVYTGRWETRFWDPGDYSIAVEAADQFGGVGTSAVPFVLA
jgi:serine protease AprX